MGVFTMCCLYSKGLIHQVENLIPPRPRSWLSPLFTLPLLPLCMVHPTQALPTAMVSAQSPPHMSVFLSPLCRSQRNPLTLVSSAKRWDGMMLSLSERLSHICTHCSPLLDARPPGHKSHVWFVPAFLSSLPPKSEIAEYLNHTGLARHVSHRASRLGILIHFLG